MLVRLTLTLLHADPRQASEAFAVRVPAPDEFEGDVDAIMHVARLLLPSIRDELQRDMRKPA